MDSLPYLAGIAVAVILLLALVALSVIVPVELLFIASIATVLLAATSQQEGSDQGALFYARFLPPGLLLIKAVLSIITAKPPDAQFPRDVLIPFGLLAIIALVSTLYSTDPFLTAQRSVSMILVVFGFSAAMPIYLNRPTRVGRLMFIIGCIIGLAVLWGFIQPSPRQLTSSTVNYVFPGVQRAYGLFANPNTLGVISMLNIFMLAASWHYSGRMARVAILIMVAVCVAGVIASGSRASLLGSITGVAFYLAFRFPMARVATIGLVIIALIMALTDTEDLNQIPYLRDSGRLAIWDNYWRYVQDSPIIGKGFAAGDVDYELYLSYRRLDPTLQTHNSYLRLFVGLGTTGVLIAGIGFSRVLVSATLRVSGQAEKSALIWPIAGIVAGMINAIFEEWLFSFGSVAALLFWFLFIVVGIWIRETATPVVRLPPAAARGTRQIPSLRS